jgi:regulator of protease activity HflC (stomatin/prohibitin superfamily)
MDLKKQVSTLSALIKGDIKITKKQILLIILLVGVWLLLSLEKVPVGHKGLKVYTYATDKKGEIEQLSVGRHFIAPFRELFVFPTFSQNYTWSEDNVMIFQSKDGLTLEANLMVRYYFQDDKITELFSKFRLGADDIRDSIVRNTIRDQLNRESVNYNAEEAFSTKKNELLDKAFNRIKSELSPFGIIIESMGFIGQIQLPDNVMRAINNKIEAKQIAEKEKSKIETEKALAEAGIVKQEGLAKAKIVEQEGISKAKIIEAIADSKANKLREQSLTPRVLELRRLEIQMEQAKRWNGSLPQVQGSATPIIDLRSKD